MGLLLHAVEYGRYTAMIAVEVKFEIDRLNAACRQYSELSQKGEAETIRKQAATLGYNLKAGLKALAPAKGEVRAERLAALQSGGGVHVRPGVYELIRNQYGSNVASIEQHFKGPNNELAGTRFVANRTMNLQSLAVQKEINLRESGRGFMAWSVPNTRSLVELEHRTDASRYGDVLSTFDLDVRPDAQHKRAEFMWDASSPAVAGLSVEQQMAVIENAIRVTADDVLAYVDRKLEENRREAFA